MKGNGMSDYLEAKAEFTWVDRPTLMSGVTAYTAFPGQIHTVYSEDGGESWYVAFGPKYPKKWVKLTTTPLRRQREVSMMGKVREWLG